MERVIFRDAALEDLPVFSLPSACSLRTLEDFLIQEFICKPPPLTLSVLLNSHFHIWQKVRTHRHTPAHQLSRSHFVEQKGGGQHLVELVSER